MDPSYPVVKHSHVVPKVYLRGWERDGKVRLTLARPDAAPRDVALKDAGVLKNFYRRTRPDGTAIYDIEWSLGHIESAVGPLLRDVRSAWPLSLRDKVTLAEFFGLQFVRGLAFRGWQAEFLTGEIQRLLDEGVPELDGLARDLLLPQAVRRFEKRMSEDTERFLRMISLSHKLASALASMHWVLLEFERPLLTTSDEPVVLWPLNRRVAEPQRNDPSYGILNTIEVRAPVSSRQLLLMCWHDEVDAASSTRGRPHHARATNAFTIANARKGWFAEPGSAPPMGAGTFFPLGPQLIDGYGPRSATASVRRARITEQLQPLMGTLPRQPGRQEFPVVDFHGARGSKSA